MKEVYIHIGSYKTGTTAIQGFCNENRVTLSKSGCYYPTRPGGDRICDAHHGFALSLFKEYGGKPASWYKDENSLEDYIQKYLIEISEVKENKILFSSEEFCQFIYLDDPYQVIEKLKNILISFNVKIIFYARDPLSLVKSLYNQRMREVSRNIPLRSFIDWFYFLDKKIMLPYEVLPIWEDVFGQENIKIQLYSKNDSDHIDEFFNLMGLPSVAGNKQIIRNVKLDDRELEKRRVSEVFSLIPSNEIENYLSPLVFLDANKWGNLQIMIENVNKSYKAFHTKHFEGMEYNSITIFDLISHNQKLVSLDASSYLRNKSFICEMQEMASDLENSNADSSRRILAAIEKSSMR